MKRTALAACAAAMIAFAPPTFAADITEGADISVCGFGDNFQYPDNVPGTFAGTWVGAWGNDQIAHTLVINSIDNGVANGIYVNGAYAPWGVQASCFSINGEVDGNVLVIEWPDIGITATYTMDTMDADTLDGTYAIGGNVTPGQLQRAQ